MRRVLICGGRHYDNWKVVQRALTGIHEDGGIGLVISGGAPGADRLAERWASIAHVPLSVYPAHWHMGRRAGPMRNGWMLEFGKPDLIVAFPGGAGTGDMMAKARAAGIEIIEPQHGSAAFANCPMTRRQTPNQGSEG